MRKNQIRTDVVKESLLDYENLAKSLKENTANAVKSLLSETVKETYAKMLTEDDDKDYEEEEVEDTEVVDANEENPSADEETEAQEDTEVEIPAETDEPAEEIDSTEEVSVEEPEETGEDEWAEFDKYKVNDDEYDFTNAEDEEIVKVYKLLKNGDEVVVDQKDDSQVNLKDNTTGAEYLIDLGNSDSVESTQDNEFDDMNESQERLFELVLEYDSNVGFTDSYQKKTAMTTLPNNEPGKNVNDWDAGVPKGTEKPFSGYKNKSKADQPYTAGEGKKVEETVELPVEECGDMEQVEEGTTIGGYAQQNSTSKSHVPNSNGRNARNASKGGVKIKGTADPRYDAAPTNEAFEKRLNKIVNENKKMVDALNKFRTALKEAAVVNYNLGKVISLISENTTTSDEKREIISRFNKEAKTTAESDKLYESISRELKKNQKIDINEEKQMVAEGSTRMNETPIYKSKEVLDMLDLMHRMK